MRVAVETEIAAPREVVWSYLIDPDHHLEFMDGMSRWEPQARVQGTKRTGVGARFAMRMRVGSVELGGVVEIVEFDPPCDMAWTSVTGIDHRGRWRLRPGQDGRTCVELRVTYFSPRGFIGPIADLIAWPIVRGHLQRSLQGLARRVETLPTARSAGALGTRQHPADRTRTARRHQ